MLTRKEIINTYNLKELEPECYWCNELADSHIELYDKYENIVEVIKDEINRARNVMVDLRTLQYRILNRIKDA